MDEAIDIWHRSTRLFSPGEREVDMPQALRLAGQHNISVYDAQYMALAMELSALYVTEDRQILKAFSDIAVSMQEFCDKRIPTRVGAQIRAEGEE